MVQLERRTEHKSYSEGTGSKGGPVVKNLTSSAGVAGSVPGWGTRVRHALEQLSLGAATRGEAPLLQQRPRTARKERK